MKLWESTVSCHAKCNVVVNGDSWKSIRSLKTAAASNGTMIPLAAMRQAQLGSGKRTFPHDRLSEMYLF